MCAAIVRRWDFLYNYLTAGKSIVYGRDRFILHTFSSEKEEVCRKRMQ